MSAWIIATFAGVVRVPSSSGMTVWAAGIAAGDDWLCAAFLRTLAMGGVLGNECESFGGINTSGPRHHPNFN
ncbi:MAG: hypothetical protein IT361_05045 [Gemmatimonadaceae bacterium]|nr:hypothetical protein [Gemmatimonadaceae bacterium]